MVFSLCDLKPFFCYKVLCLEGNPVLILQYMEKKFKDVIISPKPVYKYPPWSGGKLTVTHSLHSLADETQFKENKAQKDQL